MIKPGNNGWLDEASLLLGNSPQVFPASACFPRLRSTLNLISIRCISFDLAVSFCLAEIQRMQLRKKSLGIAIKKIFDCVCGRANSEILFDESCTQVFEHWISVKFVNGQNLLKPKNISPFKYSKNDLSLWFFVFLYTSNLT